MVFVQGFISFLVAGFLLMLVMSIINLCVVGRDMYLKHLKSLFRFTIDKSFFLNRKVTGTWGNRSINITEGYHYFIDVRSDNEVVMIRSMEGYLEYFKIHFIKKVKDDWVYTEINFKNSCPLVFLLRYLALVKMKNNRVNDLPVTISDASEIDKFINSEISQIIRDKKIKTILNENH